jgi:hypothetical protein
MLEDFEQQPIIPSPDKTKAVQLTKDYKFQVSNNGAVISNFELPDISCYVEVGWSPDSSQFFISYSSGGAIGRYHVYLYRVTENEMKASGVPTQIAERFKRKHWCEARGNNLWFLGWTPNSKTGFFEVGVYPTGECGKELGLSLGYAVNLENGTVSRVFTEKQTEAIEKSCYASGRLVLPPK